MQNSSHKLSTPVAVSVNVNKKRINIYALNFLHLRCDCWRVWGIVTFPFVPNVTSTSSNHSNIFMAGDQLVVPIGVMHISLPLHQIQSREQEKKEQTLGVNSSAERELCNTAFPVYICRLTLAWISSETSTKLLECRLDLLSLVWTLSHADSPLCSGVQCRLPCPSSVNCPLLSPFVSLSDWRTFTSSGHVEIAGPKPFVWFRAKTDKGIVCLADHLHSVTVCYQADVKLVSFWSQLEAACMSSHSDELWYNKTEEQEEQQEELRRWVYLQLTKMPKLDVSVFI